MAYPPLNGGRMGRNIWRIVEAVKWLLKKCGLPILIVLHGGEESQGHEKEAAKQWAKGYGLGDCFSQKNVVQFYRKSGGL